MKPAKQLFEERLTEVSRILRECDWAEAPFPLVGNQALIWMQSEQECLRWVLEMME